MKLPKESMLNHLKTLINNVKVTSGERGIKITINPKNQKEVLEIILDNNCPIDKIYVQALEGGG